MSVCIFLTTGSDVQDRQEKELRAKEYENAKLSRELEIAKIAAAKARVIPVNPLPLMIVDANPPKVVAPFVSPVVKPPKTPNAVNILSEGEREFEIADDVKMVFCWIPVGKSRLGSPLTEPSRNKSEVEHEFATEGFWLAKTECMQKEWEAVMGKNPSFHCESGRGVYMARGLDTGNFPVENVSWDDIQLFLVKLNKRDGVAKAFGQAGTFKLPNGDQWEYAYRGGKGNEQTFYWGYDLNAKMANCDDAIPYGTVTKETPLGRTTAVGSYAKVVAHPWGLSDMSGNVSEWCDDLQIRGGSYREWPRHCRASSGGKGLPSYSREITGFRVCLN